MVDNNFSEAMVEVYRLLKKKCLVIDSFIKNHALYYDRSSVEYGALETINDIASLIERKNKLINLKIIIDNAIDTLNDVDKKMLLLKINYSPKITNIGEILKLTDRSVFRRIEHAYKSLAQALTSSKYYNKLKAIVDNEEWILKRIEKVKERHEAYHQELKASSL